MKYPVFRICHRFTAELIQMGQWQGTDSGFPEFFPFQPRKTHVLGPHSSSLRGTSLVVALGALDQGTPPASMRRE